MKRLKKIVAGVLVVVVLLVIAMVATPFIFEDKVAGAIKSITNSKLKTELNFSEMDISFFSHFPHLTVGLKDFSLKASAPFEKEPLVAAREIFFGINVLSLFDSAILITRVYLDEARVNILYDDKGGVSYDVYKSDSIADADTASSGSASLKIENISFTNSRFVYADASIPVRVELRGLNYSGKSHLGNDILNLTSKIRIDSLDFMLGKQSYVKSQPIEAELTTKINTRSLNIVFEKNDLKIRGVPLSFQGEFSFLKGGYSAHFDLLSIYNNEFFSIALKLHSTDKVWVFAKAGAKMDVGKWTKAYGVDAVDLRGIFDMDFEAAGYYFTGRNPDRAKNDTVLLSIPKFKMTAAFYDGYLKYQDLPQALTGVTFNLKAEAPDADYRNINLQIDDLKARFLKNNLEGFFHLKGLADLPVEAKLTTLCNLAELKEVIPLDSIDLKGMLDLQLDVKGNYAPDKKLFPVSNITLKLTDGSLQTKYYPQPLEQINVDATITNGTGAVTDTRVKVEPLSFRFEGHPFEIRVDVQNPDNVAYNITSKGTLDIAKIYKVFSRKGLSLDGHIETNLALRGQQSDAMAGRYEKLHNSGKLVLKNIGFYSDYLPKQFLVREGVFRFENDKMWFEKFLGIYGASDIRLDGYLSNVVNYLLSGKKLTGNFKFTSNQLTVDEFLAPAQADILHPATASAEPAPVGVIMIPANLEIGLNADLKKVLYSGMTINDLKAAVDVRDGLLLLKGMSFELIGCKVSMNASYGSINPAHAFFDFHVTANDFDVKRAYNEVPLFRDLASSASSAEGIISLDYTLKGKLNAGMTPVYPSLEGGGVVSLKKVKVMGLKLFTTVSKSTEKEKLKNPNLSKVELKSTIKNNVITLEQTKMKISAFRIKLSGTSSFDGKLALKMRIGLPPLGIIGINLRILGTTDDPKIKYGKGTGDDNVAETEYQDEMPEELKKKLKNAKDDDREDDPDPESK
jgi:AsmA protein